MSNREDYLDSLLLSVAKPEEAGEKEAVLPKTPERRSSKKEEKETEPSPEDEFLKSFEQEFLDMDAEAFLKEYEESLSDKQEDEFSLEEAEDDFVDALDDMMVDTMSGEHFGDLSPDTKPGESQALDAMLGEPPADLSLDAMLGEPPTDPAPEKKEQGLEDFMEQDPLADLAELLAASKEAAVPDTKETEASLPKNPKAGASKEAEKMEPQTGKAENTLPPKDGKAEKTNLDTLFDDLDLTGVDFEVLGGEKPKEPAQPVDEDAELIDLLAGMSGDSDIAQITDMLKAHDNDQQMFGDEISNMDMLGGSEDELGFLDDLQAGDGGKEKKKEKRQKKSKQEKPKKEKAKADGEASGGFLAKLSKALFGEDEEDELVLPKTGTLDGVGVENISEENKTILMEMDKEQSGKGKKKKEKKEKKEKEKKPEKKKAPKPKKEKKPKEKGEPIPVKPLILTTILGVSLVVLVILGSNLLGYSTGIQAAEDAYNRGEYMEAYRQLEGLKIKNGDQKLYDRVRLTAYMQKQLEFYEIYRDAGMLPEALDALIQALNRYDVYLSDAEEAGASGEYEGMYTEVEQRLSETFSVTPEEARQIYACEDRKEYTVRLQEFLDRAGLFEE